MANVVLSRVSKNYSGGPASDSAKLAVDDISLQIEDREFLVLVGPSGCGKSTTLRLIAGLETCTAGEIRIGDHLVDDVQSVVAPKDRDIAMVFQSYALYPHMSVYKNLSFGLTLRYGGGIVARGLRRIFQPKRAAELAALRGGIDVQVRQTAERLGISKLLDRKPHQLSGGERQRVALGRAIVRKPAAFLFDEPLSNLDAKLRQQMRVELKRLHGELNTTMIYVTHDQVEAMTLGDRVAVMNEGKILQVGRPLDVYQHPASLFVARFIGNVPMNLRQAKVDRKSNEIVFNGDAFQFRFKSEEKRVLDSLAKEGQSRSVVIGFRCEDVRAELFQGPMSDLGKAMETKTVSGEPSVPNALGRVVAVDRLGDSTLIHLDQVGRAGNELKREGWNSGLIVVRATARTECQVGDHMVVTVDPQKVLWFDADSGENLLKEKT